MKKDPGLKKRLRFLKYAPYAKKFPRKKKRDRVTQAIEGKHTMRKLSPEVTEYIIERACLKAQITRLSKIHGDKPHNTLAILIAEKICQIESLTKKIKQVENARGHKINSELYAKQ